MTTQALPRNRTCCGEHTRYAPHCQPCRDQRARYERHRSYDEVNGRPRVVPNLGTSRRVQALVANGWSLTAIGERLGGVSKDAVHNWMTNRAGQVRVATHNKVRDLYDELGDRPGGNTKSAAAARRRGWAKPNQWLDPDDPDETPDPGWTPGHVDAHDVAFLASTGETWPGLEARFGIERHSLQAVLHKAGMSDVAQRINLATNGPEHLGFTRRAKAVA